MRQYFLGLSTFLVLIFNSAHALDGIIIVLEAPLLKAPSMSSTVLQMIRKGDKVYIPNAYSELIDVPEFIPTFDRAGNSAFVPSRYVKIVTGTTEEYQQPIHYAGHDPTDYRLEEPIPKTYPFEDRNLLRASIALLMANNISTVYNFNSPYDSQKYSSEVGARFFFTNKVAFDKYDRFYFGMIGFISTAKNTTIFKNDTTAKERRNVFRAGPWFTYDAFKNEKYRLSIGTGFTYNYHRSFLSVESNTQSEDRLFSGYSLTPMTSSTFQINEVLPNTDFLTGVDFNLFLPHTVKSSEKVKTPELWGEDNQMSSGIKAQVALYFGLQFKY